MSYTVVIGSVEIRCETTEEAISLARAAGGKSEAQAGEHQDKSRDHEGGSRWNESRFREFFSHIQKGKQAALIALLLESQHGRTDRALRQALNLQNNLELSGIMAGLVKNAKKVGILSGKEILQKEILQQGDERVIEYRLTDTFRSFAERHNQNK
jgi:hypothetical protein